MGRPAVFALSLFLAPAALACGEGVFHMGEGLPLQGYLAPRPVAVLVYQPDRAADPARGAVYRGIAQAGHQVTLAHDAAELAAALNARHFDVVIAGVDHLDLVAGAVPATAPEPRLLPVLGGDRRSQRELRERFPASVREGAGAGQYLSQINRLVRN